ncbi:MAG: ATP-binding cassette domain-containing protein [Dissulfuribacterales bacterium]
MYLRCDDLAYTYSSDAPPVFRGVHLLLNGPGFYALFGLSGVGKSTLARLLGSKHTGTAGVMSGNIQTDMQTILYAHDSERLPGWISIERHLYGVVPSKNHGLLKRLIQEYGLNDVVHQRFSSLSMGQKNRVNIIRYLLQDWDMLITDEVLANVDEPTRYTILSSIKTLFSNRIVLYISHNAIEVVHFSKNIFVLPQTLRGSEGLIQMQGLDQLPDAIPNEQMVQTRLYELLKAAGAGAEAA